MKKQRLPLISTTSTQQKESPDFKDSCHYTLPNRLSRVFFGYSCVKFCTLLSGDHGSASPTQSLGGTFCNAYSGGR